MVDLDDFEAFDEGDEFFTADEVEYCFFCEAVPGTVTDINGEVACADCLAEHLAELDLEKMRSGHV